MKNSPNRSSFKTSEEPKTLPAIKGGSEALSPRRAGFFSIFRPAPPAPVTLTDPAQIAAKYSRWQMRVLIFATLGYATFYLVRKNYSVVQPIIGADLGISKKGLGLILTLHGIVYGISKFLNGFLADRSNACVFMATALIASALLNIWFGFSSSLVIFIIIWMVNGWFQGMGFPPCARLLANWFPPKRTRHQILHLELLPQHRQHRHPPARRLPRHRHLLRHTAFYPELAALLFRPGGDCPAHRHRHLENAAGYAALGRLAGSRRHRSSHRRKRKRTKISKPSSPNRFSATNTSGSSPSPISSSTAMRYAVFDWGTTILKEAKHIEIADSKWMLAGFEVFGFAGAMLGGWFSDKFLGGRTVRACVVYMALAGVSVLLFWKIPAQSKLVTTGLLCATGFFVYGPQCLLAIACANLATKRAAATAVGLTSIFGYASTLLSGVGLGALVDHFGWDAGFIGIIACAVLGTALFILAWPAKAHGYQE